MFEFKHIKAFDRTYMDNPGPMVVFATPGMLHAGLSLQIFKRWCTSEKNMVIMPGYCVQGTVGHKILNGVKKIDFDGHPIDIKISVQYMSFSAHADAKGKAQNFVRLFMYMMCSHSLAFHNIENDRNLILYVCDWISGIIQLIRQAAPKHVMLVHGEEGKMQFLKSKINSEFGVECYMPANGETVTIQTECKIPLDASLKLIKRAYSESGMNLFVVCCADWPLYKPKSRLCGVIVLLGDYKGFTLTNLPLHFLYNICTCISKLYFFGLHIVWYLLPIATGKIRTIIVYLNLYI